MKIKFYLFPILALILIACESPSPEMPDLGIMGMQLVRFKSSEHIQYVAVEEVPVEFDTIKGYPSDKLVGTKSAYKIRGAGGVCQELFLGHSPYIELVNDYFLVDWKWGNFIYKPSNVLIDVAWQGVQDRQQIWDLQTDVISSNFIYKWGSTNRADIDRYLNITPAPDKDYLFNVSTDHARPVFLGKYHTLSDLDKGQYTVDDYMHEVARQDSLQNVYIERLKQIIQDGGLKEVAYIYNN